MTPRTINHLVAGPIPVQDPRDWPETISRLERVPAVLIGRERLRRGTRAETRHYRRTVVGCRGTAAGAEDFIIEYRADAPWRFTR